MSNYEIKLSVQMIEIYKGDLLDLLVPKKEKDRPKLDVRFNKGDNYVQIKNAIIKEIITQD